MSRSTEPVTVKKARKKHVCSWCPEPIEENDTYIYYRWFDPEGFSIVKMHPECYAASVEVATEEGGEFEFQPQDQLRGCSCDGDGCCNYCQTHRPKELKV
jgi:hypothetical protein